MALSSVSEDRIEKEQEGIEAQVPATLTNFIFDYEAICQPGFWASVGIAKNNSLRVILNHMEWVLYKTPLKAHIETKRHSPIVEHLLALICSSAEVRQVCVAKLNEGKAWPMDQELTYGLVNLFQEQYGRRGFAPRAWECVRCSRIIRGPGRCDFCNYTARTPHRVKARKVLCFCTREDQFCRLCTTGGYAGRLHYTYLTDDGPLNNLSMQYYNCWETTRYRRPFYRHKFLKIFRCETCFQRDPGNNEWDVSETAYYDMRFQHIISDEQLGWPYCEHCNIQLMHVRRAEGCARCEVKAVVRKEILLRERTYRTIYPYLQERMPDDPEQLEEQ